jgi:hypothetical protein
MEQLRFKRVPSTPFSHDVASSNFFLFGWLKGELSSRQVSEIDEIFENVGGVQSTLTPDTIARVFRN